MVLINMVGVLQILMNHFINNLYKIKKNIILLYKNLVRTKCN